MKILTLQPSGTRSNRCESGMASLIFITLLTIMMILVMAELHCVVHLKREVKFLEQQQIKRLNLATAPLAKGAPAPNKPASP
jgi:hypothetical protein